MNGERLVIGGGKTPLNPKLASWPLPRDSGRALPEANRGTAPRQAEGRQARPLQGGAPERQHAPASRRRAAGALCRGSHRAGGSAHRRPARAPREASGLNPGRSVENDRDQGEEAGQQEVADDNEGDDGHRRGEPWAAIRDREPASSGPNLNAPYPVDHHARDSPIKVKAMCPCHAAPGMATTAPGAFGRISSRALPYAAQP